VTDGSRRADWRTRSARGTPTAAPCMIAVPCRKTMILICGILALDSCPSATSLRQMRMPFPVGLANRILTGEPFKSLVSFACDQRAITASFL
jgi:hypothetical protein